MNRWRRNALTNDGATTIGPLFENGDFMAGGTNHLENLVEERDVRQLNKAIHSLETQLASATEKNNQVTERMEKLGDSIVKQIQEIGRLDERIVGHVSNVGTLTTDVGALKRDVFQIKGGVAVLVALLGLVGVWLKFFAPQDHESATAVYDGPAGFFYVLGEDASTCQSLTVNLVDIANKSMVVFTEVYDDPNDDGLQFAPHPPDFEFPEGLPDRDLKLIQEVEEYFNAIAKKHRRRQVVEILKKYESIVATQEANMAKPNSPSLIPKGSSIDNFREVKSIPDGFVAEVAAILGRPTSMMQFPPSGDVITSTDYAKLHLIAVSETTCGGEPSFERTYESTADLAPGHR